MNFHLSIRVKLFLSILLAILVSYTILLFLTIHSIENTFENRIARELDTNLRFIRYQLFTGANQLRYVLLFPSSRPQVKTYLHQRNEKELSGVLKSIQKPFPFLSFASFVDPQGRVIASLGNRNSGPFELDGLVKTAFRKREVVLSFELADSNMFCREGESCSSGQPGESVLAAAVAFPILDETGALLGTMVAAVPVNISSVIPNQIQEALGHDLETGIALKNLTFIKGSDEDIVIPAATAEVILPLLQKGKTYRGELRFGKSLYNTAFEPITNSQGEFIGALSVALSKEHFNTMRRDYFSGTMASAIFATLLAFLIAYFSSRWLASPLKELSKGVQCIEEGNLDFRVAIDATGEFEMLADSFNRMADALRERDTTIRNKTFDLEMLNRCLYEMNELLESNVKERTVELEMEKGKLEAILASMAEGIVVTDGNNRVILFNSAAQRIFGIAPYKVIGRHVEDIDMTGEFHQLLQGLREVKSEDLLVGNEKEVTVGRKKLRISLSPFLDQSLEFAGVVMSIRDVTHEEEVDRMKTEFISTVSHELKTPLTSMKGSLQLILGKGEGLTETERELIRVCHRNTDRLIRLIKDILDISKIEAGRVDLNVKPESINSLVAYSLEELDSFARENNVTLVNSVTLEGVPVLGDHDRLIQVLTNLLSNAVKFSPPGKTVTVTAQRDGDLILVSVIDEGKTIERADREMLFHKFPQLRGGQAREFGGTGLGLAICKEIVEKHHGKISYQAGKAGGNIFRFYGPGLWGESMTRERILIVDDEADIALILKLQLEDAGYETIRAKDGGEALEFLHREEFSLVLLDIKLPKLDGIQVLEHLGPALQEMAIVMMTAHGSEDVAVESMKKGALDYIAKPFSAEDLLKKVGRALEFNKTRKENLLLQHQLEEERKKLAAILAGMADMMVATDSDGRVIRINQATADALGVDPDSPLGMPVEDLFASDLPPARLPCKVVLRTLSACLDVSHSIHGRDRIIPVLSSATPLFGASGKLVGSVEILRDISHLKALEKEREEFVSMLTHDLKTPLTAVMGSVDLVRECRLGAINDEQKEYLDSATESCGEIVEMIDTLLDVYRFESGKMSLAFTEEDLAAILNKSLSSFRALAERSDITLSAAIAADLPYLRLDRNKVGRLFGNLLSNAFKFTEEGGMVKLSAVVVKDLTGIRERIPPGTYQAELIPDRGSFVKVEVSDTGIGIPKDALGSIFDKFVQARNRREGKIRGTGLGLAFCRKVMDAHGGLLWAESDLNKGSVFTVLFPLVPKERAGA